MSRNTKNVSTKKPYCKVCHDAGKPESDYTSHWVKDLTGKTTCPTLLNTECRYCFKLGHTAKFCDDAAKNNKEKEKEDRRSKAEATRKAPAPTVQKKSQNAGVLGANGFAALCDSDSEEESEFPALNVVKKEEQALTGWAAIAAKPKEQVKAPVATLAQGMIVMSKKSKKEPEPKAVAAPKPAPWAKKDVVVAKKWADWSDSEYEDDVLEYATGEVESCTDAWD